MIGRRSCRETIPMVVFERRINLSAFLELQKMMIAFEVGIGTKPYEWRNGGAIMSQSPQK